MSVQDGYYWARMHHGGEVEIVEIINSDSDVLVCARRFNFDDMLRLDEFDIIEGVQPPDRVFIADRTVPPGWRLPSYLKDETLTDAINKQLEIAGRLPMSDGEKKMIGLEVSETVSPSIDIAALEAAREIEALPREWPFGRRVAAIQVIIVRAMQTEEKTMQDRMLQFFEYAHLREDLQQISKPFGELAKWIVENLPENPERTAGLRKLLETKDCIVRARIYKETRGVAESPKL